MKILRLSNGQSSFVDDDVFEWAKEINWCASRSDWNTYVVNYGETPKAYLHRKIMHAPKGVQVHHVNGDTLDNRRENLRLASNSENCRGARKRNDTYESRYRGVGWYRRDEVWRAQIVVNGKQIHLGYFDLEVDAARAYNRAAREHFGEFATENKV